MVLAAQPAAQDFHVHSSGSFSGRSINPPPIYKTLTREEIENMYGLFKGSGGILDYFYSAEISGSRVSLLHLEELLPTNIAQVIDNLQAAFALTQDELTKVCKVQSRMTLNNWKKMKSSPRATTLNRLLDLDMAAQAWLEKGFSNERNMLQQPVIGEMSLFDLLNHDKIDSDLILFAGSRIQLSVPAEDLEDPFA